MVVPSISDSLPSERTPGDRMFRDLTSIKIIRCVVVVVLIRDDDIFGLASSIEVDLEEYSDMFTVRESETIVRLPIETGDHHTLIFWEDFGIESFREVDEWDAWEPLGWWGRSTTRDRLCECDTLSGISCLRKLWKELISRIANRPSIWRIGDESEILGIDRLSWHTRIMRR